MFVFFGLKVPRFNYKAGQFDQSRNFPNFYYCFPLRNSAVHVECSRKGTHAIAQTKALERYHGQLK